MVDKVNEHHAVKESWLVDAVAKLQAIPEHKIFDTFPMSELEKYKGKDIQGLRQAVMEIFDLLERRLLNAGIFMNVFERSLALSSGSGSLLRTSERTAFKSYDDAYIFIGKIYGNVGIRIKGDIAPFDDSEALLLPYKNVIDREQSDTKLSYLVSNDAEVEEYCIVYLVGQVVGDTHQGDDVQSKIDERLKYLDARAHYRSEVSDDDDYAADEDDDEDD